MYKISVFNEIRVISDIGDNNSSFMFECGNVLVVTELTDATVKYFTENIQFLNKYNTVAFILTERLINSRRLPIYGLIKKFNERINVCFLSLAQKSYIEADLKISSNTTSVVYQLDTNDLPIYIELMAEPSYRVLYQIGDSEEVIYTGTLGKIQTNDIDMDKYSKKIITINRRRLGDLSTQELWAAMYNKYGLGCLDIIFLGYKSKTEKDFFHKQINSLWQVKIEAPAAVYNTAIEKAKETITDKKIGGVETWKSNESDPEKWY